jgi:hypothetical protein
LRVADFPKILQQICSEQPIVLVRNPLYLLNSTFGFLYPERLSEIPTLAYEIGEIAGDIHTPVIRAEFFGQSRRFKGRVVRGRAVL